MIEILASEHKWDKARKKHELQMAKDFLETFKSSKNAQFHDGKHTSKNINFQIPDPLHVNLVLNSAINGLSGK